MAAAPSSRTFKDLEKNMYKAYGPGFGSQRHVTALAFERIV